MNKKIINKGWQFTKEKIEVKAGVLAKGKWQNLDLPYTWNGKDGQDGGNDYYRGTCYFAKTIKKEELPEGEEFYLQFEGTNSSAEVFVNGKSVASHDGGYSTWRVNLTEFASADMELVVAVDNSPNDRVYPQNADFTFYGGIYRDVTLIGVPKAHFDLDYYGCQGIMVTPEVKGSDAQVKIEVWPVNVPDSAALEFVIKDGDTVVESATVSAKDTAWETVIKDVHLWDGRKDPHLYTACVALKDGDRVLDERCVRFGCRSFVIDPEKGFILNGKEYPLRGVSRHQDRPDIGNALSHADHEDDLRLIMEMGATTIRLAHYQHDQYFYDLCDEAGMVLWAEIPYISNHMPGGRENTISQMKELVYQNYNHPSIVVWGLSNEITMSGADDPDLIENHHILNDLCHELDKTRPTTMAVVSMCEMDEEYVRIPDTRSYNHYFGWYGGDTSMNGPWFDEYHAKYPKEPVG
ncbi:MAG: glycoside hydrolase family 2 protein, partial [Pseudobutyrivibrio sp.]|nr:glycoside hydrolase family 2 protein [Pseudobutyrivibrio sp.]